MCGGYRLEVDVETLTEAFGVQRTQLDLPWPAEAYPGGRSPVVLDRRDRQGIRVRHLGPLTWGLVPHWARDPRVGRRLFNARCESLREKPSYREAFARRRCLVPVSAFYEWSGEAGRKRKYMFYRPHHPWLALAGLWEVWRSATGERLGTFTVVTTAANGCVAPVHPRMPLLVAETHWEAWLAPGQDAAALSQTLRADTARVELASVAVQS